MTRCLRLPWIALALETAAAVLSGQGAPILGTAPVALTPSATTPIVDDQFTVDVTIDLTSVTGVPPGGGSTPVVLSGFDMPIAFDRTRLLLLSVAPGPDPSFATGLDVTAVAAANASGRFDLVNAQAGASVPSGVVSVARLTFKAVRAGPADLRPDSTGLSLSSAIQTSGATLFGPASVPAAPHDAGIVVQGHASLFATMSASPSPVTPEGKLTYTIRVENKGGAAAAGVVLSDGIPAGTQFAAVTGGGIVAGGVATWNLGSVAAGASVTVTLAVTVTAASGSNIQNDSGSVSLTGYPSVPVPAVVTPVDSSAPNLAGTILAAASLGDGTIFDVTTGTPRFFAYVDSGGWLTQLVAAPNGHIYAACNKNQGTIYDITTGGNLSAATPFATGIFATGGAVLGLAADAASNLYAVEGYAGTTPVAVISPTGAVSFLPVSFTFPAAALVVGQTLYVSEGGSGAVKAVNLTNNAVTAFASGFTTGTDHFSGQLGQDPRGRLFVLWGNASKGYGLFDITAGGSFSAATPLVPAPFRIDVNQFAFDADNNVYFAGDGYGAVYRSAFSAGTFGAATPFAGGVGDSEALAIVPISSTPDLSILKAASAASAVSGRTLTYTLTYRNRGAGAAANAVIADTLPAGASFVSATNGGSLNGSVVQWSVASVPGRSSSTLSFTVQVAAAAGAVLSNTTYSITADGLPETFGPRLDTPVLAPPSLTIAKTANPTVPSQGFVSYTISVANTGGSDATTVAVDDTVPAGTSFVSASDQGTLAAGVVRWSLGTLSPGQSRTVSLVVKATAAASTTITNATYHAAADLLTPVAGPPVSVTVTATTLLTVSQTVAPNPVVVGTRVNSTLTYTNASAGPITNVLVQNTLPPAMSLLSVNDGGAASGNTITWSLGTLAAGATGTLRFSARADGPAPATAASVYSIQGDATSLYYGPAAPVSIRNATRTIGPGTVLSLLSYNSSQAGTIWDVTVPATNPIFFANVNEGAQFYPQLLIAPNGHAYMAVTSRWGALFDITPGGNLTGSTPFASNIFVGALGSMDGIAADAAGNIYVPNSRVANQPIARISPSGDITKLPVSFTYASGLAIVGNTLYVSEGGSGSVKTVDLTTFQVATLATGFRTGVDHFSGSLAIDPRGHILVLWSNSNHGPSLFDVTAGGNFSTAAPLIAYSHYIDDNQIAVDPNTNTFYVAGALENVIYRSIFANGSFGPITLYQSNVGDNEGIAVFPSTVLSVSKTASPSPVEPQATLTYTLTATNGGVLPVTNVTVTDTVPAGLAFQSASQGGVWNGSTISWAIPVLGASSSTAVSWSATVTSLPGSTITNAAYAISANDQAKKPGPPVSTPVSYTSQPLALDGTATPNPALSGAVITYTFRYENPNVIPVSSAVVTDPLPPGTSFVSATGGGALGAGVVTWSLGTLPAGASGTFSLTLLVNLPGGQTLTNSGCTIAADGLPTRTAPPISTPVVSRAVALSLAASAAPNPVVTGGELTYTLAYVNGGTSTATNVVLVSPVPPGTTFLSASGGGNPSAGGVTWTLGTLEPGDVGGVSFTVTVDLPGGSTVTNTGSSISSAQQGPLTGPDVMTGVEAAPPPDPLPVSLSADRNPVQTGTALAYQLTFSNPTATATAAVTVSSPIPASTSFLTAAGGGILAANGGSVQWTYPSLPAGATGSVSYAVLVTASPGQVVTNPGATITAADLPPGTSLPVVTEVVALPTNLSLGLTASPSPVLSGGALTYTLSYANVGPGAVSGAAVSDPLPDGTSFVSATNGGSLNAGVVSWSLGTLAAGAQGQVSVVVQVTAPAGTTLSNAGAKLQAGDQAVAGPTVLTDVTTTAVSLDGGVSTDKAIYDAPETVHETGAVTYAAGGTGIVSGLVARLDTMNAAGSILATSSTNLPPITQGTSSSVTLDWVSGASNAGTYAVTLTVLGPGGDTLLTRSAAFGLRSPNGAGVTGALQPTNSPVQAGTALNVHASLANAGLTAYAAFPVEIDLVDPATLQILASATTGLPLAPGANAAADVSMATAGLAPKTYPLWLTTPLTGPRLLATSSAEVTPGSQNITFTLTPAAQTVEAGSQAQITLTLTSGPQSTPTEFTLTSSDASTVSVPDNVTVPANATTQSFAGQALRVGGPVTLTATAPPSSGGGTATAAVTVSPSPGIVLCLLSFSLDSAGVLNIHGQGLMGVTQVEFNTTCATGVGTVVPQAYFLSRTDTRITLTPPAGSAGMHVILVNPAGGSSSCSADVAPAGLALALDETLLAVQLGDELANLRARAVGADLQLLDDAWTHWNAMQAVRPSDTEGAIAMLQRLLALAADLRAVSLDTSEAQALAGRLFTYWQERADEWSRQGEPPR